MLVVSVRAMEGLQHHFGVDHLPVIMSSTRVAELIMLDAHVLDHGGERQHPSDCHPGGMDSGWTQAGWEGGHALCQVQVPKEEAVGPEDGTTAYQSSSPCSTFHPCGAGQHRL